MSSLLLLGQIVLSDSASHAAALSGVTEAFSNEPFLLPAAPLALKPQATSLGSVPVWVLTSTLQLMEILPRSKLIPHDSTRFIVNAF